MNYEDQINYIKKKVSLLTKDSFLTDEITQKVVIKIFEKKYKYKTAGEFKSLLGLVIKSVFIDYCRLKINEFLIDADAESNYNPDDRIKRIEKEAFIFKCIDLLPKEQMETVLLRYYFNLKYEKIAELMGVSKNTALGYMNYAKKRLRLIITKNNLL